MLEEVSGESIADKGASTLDKGGCLWSEVVMATEISIVSRSELQLQSQPQEQAQANMRVQTLMQNVGLEGKSSLQEHMVSSAKVCEGFTTVRNYRGNSGCSQGYLQLYMHGRAPARGRLSGSHKISNQVLETDVAVEHTEEHTSSQVKPNLSVPEVLHKSLVELIFLAYNRVSSGSE